MKLIGMIISIVLLSGCASKHAYMSHPDSLGPPQWQCDTANNCQLVQMWEPSQLTPLGCWAHTIVTGGHIAWECRKPPKCALLFLNPDGSCKMPLPGPPASGRWIWKRSEP
jgi:hypothetical protein